MRFLCLFFHESTPLVLIEPQFIYCAETVLVHVKLRKTYLFMFVQGKIILVLVKLGKTYLLLFVQGKIILVQVKLRKNLLFLFVQGKLVLSLFFSLQSVSNVC